MRLLRGSRGERLDSLITIIAVLSILLIALAVIALWGDLLSLLGRFRQPIFMFVIGALLAYLLLPIVRILQKILRKRWAAILAAYLLLFLLLSTFAVLLINPFVNQAQSLIRNLHNPSPSKLTALRDVVASSAKVHKEIGRQVASGSSSISTSALRRTQVDLTNLGRAVSSISSSTRTRTQIKLPKSYTAPILLAAGRTKTEYEGASANPQQVDRQKLVQADADATQAASAASVAYANAVSTPLLLLDLQGLLDNKGVQVDLHDKFGMALKQFTSQVAGLLNNALGIALQAGSLLLTTVLVLIISVYFVSDGARFVHWLIGLVPTGSQKNAAYLAGRLDEILGSYLRVQVLMALLAAILDSIGAVVLGVPYAIVIFFSTFFLSLIPVIGPVVLPIPPMLIAVVFAPLPKPIFYLVWLLIGEQIATNVIGPRIQGKSVGIHPLEAMAAALVGFPLGGFLGSFFAVPFVAFAHVIAREVFRVRAGLPAEEDSGGGQSEASPGPSASRAMRRES